MQWFKDLRTATKLMLGFGLMALLMATVGYLGIRGMTGIQTDLVNLHDHDALGIMHLGQANVALVMTAREIRAMLLASDPSEMASLRQQLLANRERFNSEMAQYQKLIYLPEAKVKAEEAVRVIQGMEKAQDDISDLAAKNKHQEALARLPDLAATLAHADQLIAELVKLKLQVMQTALESAQSNYTASRATMLGIVLVAMALAMGLGLAIARMISRPLADAMHMLKAVSDGDFTGELAVTSRDEVGQMAESVNLAVANMRQALLEVSQASGNVSTASQELAKASEAVASGAQQQASSLEETASSLEEISSTIKQNAENARQASQLAAGSREAAEKGGQVVNQAVAAMGQINEASKHIAEIITTIDEIAFQTNLLALNAAVEAARAGEQGRGFAVVASEVRNLAQRSAGAAKEIKGLIQDSVRKVENGSELVDRSGQTLGEIMQSVKRVTDIVAEIAAASQEQATGIEQVNKATMQMDQVTQGNSAQTEEMSSTAQGLSSNAEQLQALVGRFRLGSDTSRTAPAARAAKRTPKLAAHSARHESKEPALTKLAHHVGVSGNEGFEEF